jgi:hypothetical protein
MKNGHDLFSVVSAIDFEPEKRLRRVAFSSFRRFIAIETPRNTHLEEDNGALHK